jgi:hypothetical protein
VKSIAGTASLSLLVTGLRVFQQDTNFYTIVQIEFRPQIQILESDRTRIPNGDCLRDLPQSNCSRSSRDKGHFGLQIFKATGQ